MWRVWEELRVYHRYIDFVVLGTTWSVSKQAGRQATWQTAGTEVQSGVALLRVRDVGRERDERRLWSYV